MTNWHQILGRLLELLLTPLDITVQTEIMVMSEPPRIDMLLLRRESPHWTEAQRRYLPDGMRDTDASHLLVEFKATESVSADGLLKTAAYDLFYREAQKLTKADVAVFLISSKQPRQATLDKLGFVESETAGIYTNQTILAQRVQLISLNGISSELNNAFIKTFSSQKASQDRAIHTLRQREIYALQQDIILFFAAWWKRWNKTLTGEKMQLDLAQDVTFEQLVAEGELFLDLFLAAAPLEKRMQGLSIDDRLKGLSIDDILKRIPIEERFVGIPIEERLVGIPIEERFVGISAETLEAYLKTLKQAEAKAQETDAE